MHELKKGASIFDFTDNIQNTKYIVEKAAEEGKLKAFFDFIIIECTPAKIKSEKGKLIYKDLYYRLLIFKKRNAKPYCFKPHT